MAASLTRIVAFAALACVLPAAPALAADASCSSDSFAVSGKTVAATVCAAAPADGAIAVSETYVAGGERTTKTLSVPFSSGEPVARGIDDVDLGALGIAGATLHVTIRYRAGRATIEHALLLPGAIPLK
jgi:hypothetical protein